MTMSNEGRVILCCGECGNYNFKAHKCMICQSKESDLRNPFYDDCPLPKTIKAIHCKECRHMTIEQGLRYCDVWERFNGAGDDGYCNYGEQKDGD